MTKQAIPGVAPADVEEVTVMVVRPSNSIYGLGRLMGRMFANKTGVYIFTLGNMFALMSIPLALVLYFMRLLPGIGFRYKLTNRRIIVHRGLRAHDSVLVDPNRDKAVELDGFDKIEIDVRPGQEWYHAGDLVFSKEGIETFRLSAVSRPEAFRTICSHAHRTRVGVKKALEREAAIG